MSSHLLMQVSVTADFSVRADYTLARAIPVELLCGMSIIVDAPATADPATLCASSANKVGVYLQLVDALLALIFCALSDAEHTTHAMPCSQITLMCTVSEQTTFLQVGVWSQLFTTGTDWGAYTVVSGGSLFNLTKGDHTLTVCIDAGDANFDKLS